MGFILNGDAIPWEEKEKIWHEVNTLYSKYDGLRVIMHRSIGIDEQYYVYIIENYEFDDYRFIARIHNLD